MPKLVTRNQASAVLWLTFFHLPYYQLLLSLYTVASVEVKMSRSANHICGVCHTRTAMWRCACSALPLCQDSSCLGKHLSAASASPHLLMPSEAESFLSQEEAKANLKACDTAMEVSRFFEEERKWLMQRKEESVGEIEAEANRLCKEIRDVAEVAKRAAEEETTKAITMLETFRSIEQRDFVFSVKSSSKHLVSVCLEIKKLNFQDSFNLFLQSAQKKIYKNLERTSGSWSFSGTKIDALTIQVSKTISLSGLVLGQPLASPTQVKLFQVLEGESTKGPVLYNHPEATPLNQSDTEPLVKLNKPVLLLPDKKYTLKVLIAGNSTACGNTFGNRRQEELEVRLFDAQFAAGDTTNGSLPSTGIFFGFEYTSQ